MKVQGARIRKLVALGCVLIAGVGGRPMGAAQPSAAALAAYEHYVSGVEARLEQQHRSRIGFLVAGHTNVQPGAGEVVVDQVNVPAAANAAGAMVHHWRATAFAPGASARDFEVMMRDLPAYPQRFAPEVVRAALSSQTANTMQTSMRVREQHVLTVWLDVSYDVRFGALDGAHRFSVSRSTAVREVSGAGTARERTLGPDEEHGWLWRMNTYWSYEEANGGLYLQVESVSLTGAIPTGLGWAMGPYVESIPRGSLEFTMRAVCRAIQK